MMHYQASTIWEHLREEAEGDEESIEEFWGTDLTEVIHEIVDWCRKKIDEAERYPKIMEKSNQAKDKLSLSWSQADLLNKYQTALDNQLYKAIKALREAQEWRLKTLTSTASEVVQEEQPEAA